MTVDYLPDFELKVECRVRVEIYKMLEIMRLQIVVKVGPTVKNTEVSQTSFATLLF